MKTIFRIITLVALAASLAMCKKLGETQAFATVLDPAAAIPEEGGSMTFEIKAADGMPWSIEVQQGGEGPMLMRPAEWYTLSQTEGTGNATITVSGEENEWEWVRSVVLIVTCGDEKQAVKIRQDGPEFAFENSETNHSGSIGGDPCDHNNAITSRSVWHLQSKPDWITEVQPAYGPAGETEIVIWFSNDKLGDFEGELVFTTANGGTYSLPVYSEVYEYD